MKNRMGVILCYVGPAHPPIKGANDGIVDTTQTLKQTTKFNAGLANWFPCESRVNLKTDTRTEDFVACTSHMAATAPKKTLKA